MVVEDEFLIRLTLSETLRDEGFEVHEAASSDEAMQVLAAHASIGLVLTDIQLPGSMDGRALVASVRKTRPEMPVIFMTGRPDSLADAARPGQDLFISKPYMPSDVVAAVRGLLPS